jgi:MFS family permease
MPPQGGGPLARSTRAALICTILVELGCPGAFIVGTLLIAQSQGWGAVGYALCTGAIGLGTIAARFAPSFARTFRASGSGLIAGCFATALCLAVLPLSTNLAVTVVIAAVMALAAAATSAATLSVLFTATAPDQMGTVMGLVMPAGAAAAPVSIVLVGVVGQFSIDWALGVCAIALGLAGLVAGFNPVLREAKPPAMPMMQGA